MCCALPIFCKVDLQGQTNSNVWLGFRRLDVQPCSNESSCPGKPYMCCVSNGFFCFYQCWLVISFQSLNLQIMLPCKQSIRKSLQSGGWVIKCQIITVKVHHGISCCFKRCWWFCWLMIQVQYPPYRFCQSKNVTSFICLQRRSAMHVLIWDHESPSVHNH